MAFFEVRGVSRKFGAITALSGIDLSLQKGELVSVIGPNGAGKTTLFDIISGHERADAGSVRLSGSEILGLPADRIARHGVGRTFQNGRVFANLSVLDNVRVGGHRRLTAARPAVPFIGPLLELLFALAPPRAARRESAALVSEAERLLGLFGNRLLPRKSDLALSLSYANRRRLEIARALALQPRLLLLDEPTAGMNPTETSEMLGVIRSLRSPDLAILLIEHKLSLVMELSDRVYVLDEGRVISVGTPAAVRSDPAVLTAYLGHHTVGEAYA